MAIKWDPSLSVDEETIDNQHQKLLTKIDELLSAMQKNKGEPIILEIIGFFQKYADEHFTYEEKYMAEHNYPQLEEHKSLHKEFIKKYQVFKERFTNEGATKDLMVQVQNFLLKWWLNHIELEDHKYYVYIKEMEN